MLDPALAEIRRAVRAALAALEPAQQTVIAAVSGGADSLALVDATIVEAHARGIAVVSVTIDHGLQEGSAEVAETAASAARARGADDARVVRVAVHEGSGGPEAAARETRYAALRQVAAEVGASTVLLGHTLDDQAETVLLGLARGAGAASLGGMAPVRADDHSAVSWVRPLLAVRRATTAAACRASGLAPWSDPHNGDAAFARVRVRERVLPTLESELGPGIAEALARTAEQLREDAAAFAAMIDEVIEDIVEPAEAGIAISVAALTANPAAMRHRIIRHVAMSEFAVSLTRSQTLEIARLVTAWRGQGPIHLPGFTAARAGSLVVLTSTAGSAGMRPGEAS